MTNKHLAILRPGIQAWKLYWPAIFCIQSVALLIVLLYYLYYPARPYYQSIARLKTEGGLWFSAISTGLSAGVLPELIKKIFRPKRVTPPRIQEQAHFFVMWCLLGVFVDIFYRFQDYLFGSALSFEVVSPKIIVDQLIFTPLIPLPFIISWAMLLEARYRLREYRNIWHPHVLFKRMLPLWVTALSYWPPMLAILYSLPADLQFPLFLLANAAFSILMIYMARRPEIFESA